jgi:hypothetical protein
LLLEVLLSNGTAIAWGDNNYGQVGDGSYVTRYAPVAVLGLAGKIVGLDGGFSHSLALMPDGTVYAWGANSYGQLGDGSMTDRITAVYVFALKLSCLMVLCILGATTVMVSLVMDQPQTDSLQSQCLVSVAKTLLNLLQAFRTRLHSCLIALCILGVMTVMVSLAMDIRADLGLSQLLCPHSVAKWLCRLRLESITHQSWLWSKIVHDVVICVLCRLHIVWK